MKDLQRDLPFSAFAAPNRDRQAAKRQRRHLLIAGRPRRLKSEVKVTQDEIDRLVAGNPTEIGPAIELTSEAPTDVESKTLPLEIQKSEVIKVAIPPEVIEGLDRIRLKVAGGATRPEIVRQIVDEFIAEFSPMIGRRTAPREKRHGRPGRCHYLKIPFSPASIRAIGHHSEIRPPAPTGCVGIADPVLPPSGLCAVFGTTRQGVITRALGWHLQRNK